MEKRKLTTSVVAQAKARPERYTIWDSELPGFGLRITSAGARSWVIKYRTEGGGRRAPARWFTLGNYPTLTAQQAREAASKALSSVRLGHDPAGDLATMRAELRVVDLIDLYEKDGLFV